MTRPLTSTFSLSNAHAQLELLGNTKSSSDTSIALIRAAQKLNTLAPVNQLPDELLGLIFHALRLPATLLRSKVGHVCTHWRQTAICDATLWVRISLSRWSSFVVDLAILDWTADMSIVLIIDPVGFVPEDLALDKCAQQIAKHIGHISSLVFRNQDARIFGELIGRHALILPAPRMKNLIIELSPPAIRATISPEGFTSLETLKTSTTPRPGAQGLWLRGLVDLRLASPISAKQLGRILAHTPKLKRLELSHIDGLTSPDADVPLERGPMLKSLVYSGLDRNFERLFRAFPFLSHAEMIQLKAELYCHVPDDTLANLPLTSLWVHLGRSATSTTGPMLVALATTASKRRIFWANHASFTRWVREPGIVASLHRIAAPASDWSELCWMLSGHDNAALRTVALGVSAVPVGQEFGHPHPKLDVRFDGRCPIPGQPLFIRTPGLEQMALWTQPTVARAEIHPSVALLYAQQVQPSRKLPVLRLVNIMLLREDRVALEALFENVEEVLEETVQHPWMNTTSPPHNSADPPPYAFEHAEAW